MISNKLKILIKKLSHIKGDIPTDLDVFKDNLKFITHPKKDKRIIDMETLEIWETMTECAKHLKVTPQSIWVQILHGGRTKGHKLEYFDYWQGLDNKEKEKYTRKNNIYFLT